MCTNFMVKSEAGDLANARSMEFGLELGSKLFFRAAGHRYSQRFSGSKFGYEWTGKYGFAGMNVEHLPVSVDGLNTEGLSIGALWLPGSQYQAITDTSKGLSVDNFCDWVLSSFRDCNEVKAALGSVQVGFPKLLSNLLPLHFPINDARGNSIVIEFIGGEAQVHDNPVGVLTNDPVFDWQLENLRNYVDLSSWDAEPSRFGELTVKQTGHGSGLIGLPGDPTPPSRFVRAAVMSSFADPVKNADEATELAFHILNTVDIPRGAIKDKTKHGVSSDYTQWVAVKDISRQIYSVRFYSSPQVYSLDLKDVNLQELNGKQLAVPHEPASISLNPVALDRAEPVPLPVP